MCASATKALAAPQAALISALAKGVLQGDLDWNLLGKGAEQQKHDKADSDLNDSIRVSNAESQLALPFMIRTVFGVRVIWSPNGSAV